MVRTSLRLGRAAMFLAAVLMAGDVIAQETQPLAATAKGKIDLSCGFGVDGLLNHPNLSLFELDADPPSALPSGQVTLGWRVPGKGMVGLSCATHAATLGNNLYEWHRSTFLMAHAESDIPLSPHLCATPLANVGIRADRNRYLYGGQMYYQHNYGFAAEAGMGLRFSLGGMSYCSVSLLYGTALPSAKPLPDAMRGAGYAPNTSQRSADYLALRLTVGIVTPPPHFSSL